MAPEVLQRENHSFEVDYFALGVLLYECMVGRRPYQGRTRNEVRESMAEKDVKLTKNNKIKGWSRHAGEFINLLLERDKYKRWENIATLKSHEWFKTFNWTDFNSRTMKAPYIPPVAENYDK
jgi:serine/threonine protein kinase